MNINGIGTQYQNYTAAGASSIKSSSSESMFDSFQKEIVNWKLRVKQAMDKEKENDSTGSIQMSEKKWRNLMKIVDPAIDTSKDEKKEQEHEKISSRKDTVTASFQMLDANIQIVDPKLVQSSDYTAFLAASSKRD